MKALVIENQYRIDAEINGLVKDNPDLFSDVEMITGSLHRKPEELINHIERREALIISSTFLYKDQLEDVTKLLAELEGKKIFVRDLADKLEEWQENEDAYIHFYDYDEFMDNIKTCIQNHEVYSYSEDWDNRNIKDEVWERMKFADSTGRGRFSFEKITSL